MKGGVKTFWRRHPARRVNFFIAAQTTHLYNKAEVEK
jgi:hypothetical protein